MNHSLPDPKFLRFRDILAKPVWHQNWLELFHFLRDEKQFSLAKMLRDLGELQMQFVGGSLEECLDGSFGRLSKLNLIGLFRL